MIVSSHLLTIPKEKAALLAKFKDVFGYRPLVEPKVDSKDRRCYSELADLKVGDHTWIRGRIHLSRPVSQTLIFLVLRRGQETVQVVIADQPELVKFAKA